MTDLTATITRLREAARAVVNSTGQQTDGTWVIGWDGDGETLIGDLLDAVKATEDLTALLDGLEGKTEEKTVPPGPVEPPVRGREDALASAPRRGA